VPLLVATTTIGAARHRCKVARRRVPFFRQPTSPLLVAATMRFVLPPFNTISAQHRRPPFFLHLLQSFRLSRLSIDRVWGTVGLSFILT